VCELHPAGGSVEQDHAKVVLERFDLAADRLLRHMKVLGGLREVQPLGDRDEMAQPANVEVSLHRPSRCVDGKVD
jgi:hypothetical protein